VAGVADSIPIPDTREESRQDTMSQIAKLPKLVTRTGNMADIKAALAGRQRQQPDKATQRNWMFHW